MTRDRYAELKRILEERRREIMSEVQEKIRDVRTEGANSPTHGVLDAAESSEADIQDDIEFALIQMKAETLNKIEEALRRLEEGTFGYCFECGEEISERRLRALPFAVRCKDCEEARETGSAARAACCSAAAPRRSSSTCRDKVSPSARLSGAPATVRPTGAPPCYSLAGSRAGPAPFSADSHRTQSRSPGLRQSVRRDDAPVPSVE